MHLRLAHRIRVDAEVELVDESGVSAASLRACGVIRDGPVDGTSDVRHLVYPSTRSPMLKTSPLS